MDVGLQTNGRSPTRVRISTENSGERRRIEGGIEKNRPPWEDLPTILDEVLSSFGADLGGDPALHLSDLLAVVQEQHLIQVQIPKKKKLGRS